MRMVIITFDRFAVLVLVRALQSVSLEDFADLGAARQIVMGEQKRSQAGVVGILLENDDPRLAKILQEL